MGSEGLGFMALPEDKKKPEEKKKCKFVHLHCHDEFSLLDGACKIEDFIDRVDKMGFHAIAQTNHGNIDGVIKFVKACKAKGIQPIVGCELYIVENIKNKLKGEKRRHVIYLCKTLTGMHSLMKMLTIANLEGFYYRPRIDPMILEQNFDAEHAILLTGCNSGILNEKWGRDVIHRLFTQYPDQNSIFVELMPFGASEDQTYFSMAHKFAQKYGIPEVITNDIHYIKEEDWEFHEALLAIGSKKKHNDPTRWTFGEAYRGQLFMKSKKRMVEDSNKNLKFLDEADIVHAIETTLTIADMCKDFDLPKIEVELPMVVKGVRDTDEHLSHICKTALKEYFFPEAVPEKYHERLDFELERIITLGFTDMMLMVADYVEWAKDNDILVGTGRGSVGGSLVAFLLGITGIDPVRFNLLFDRFISDGRIDLPDIDMDFEDTERRRIEKYLRGKYGHNNCAFVSTFLTYRGRQSLRDAGRYMDVPYPETDKVAKSILKRSGGDMRAEFTCKDTFEVLEEARDYARTYPQAANFALQLEGRAKTVGVHAAGFVVSKDDLTLGERCVLIDRKGKITINWDKSDMEQMGLLKLDLLGLSTLSVLKDAQKLVKQRKNIDIDYYSIDPEGPESEEIYKTLFNEGHTVGIFQFTTKGLSKMCRDVGVEKFEDIVAINALYRPGALRSGLANNYVDRKHGREEIPSVCKVYDDLTKDTYGIILYQEQVMQLIYDLARMPWKTVDTIRKVISKSQGVEAFLKWKGEFVEGCKKYKTLGEEDAEILYEKLKDFGCLTGDTIVYRVSANQHKGNELTVKELYDYQKDVNFKWRKIKILSMHSDGRVRYNTVNRVIYTGKKVTYLLKLESGKTIKSTADHRFLTDSGWKMLKDISTLDKIITTDFVKPKILKGKYSGNGSGAHNEWHGEFLKRKGLVESNRDKSCQVCESDQYVEMHHKDGDIYNNVDGNLIWLCRKCHRREHISKDPTCCSRFRVGYETNEESIIFIRELGRDKTYDIEMVDEPRNFIANGIVVHNSYSFNKSHSLGYSWMAYWTAYMKFLYPVEYMCSLFNHTGDEDKLNTYMREAERLGIKIKPPDIRFADLVWAIDNENNIVAPITSIKGIGEAVTKKFHAIRKKAMEDSSIFVMFKEFSKLGKTFVVNSIRVGSFDWLGDNFNLKEYSDNYDIRLGSKSCMKKYLGQQKVIDKCKGGCGFSREERERHLEDLIKYEILGKGGAKSRSMRDMLKRSYDIIDIKDLSKMKGTDEEFCLFGKIEEIKYSYKEAVKNWSSEKKDSLGGVYGTIDDGTDNCMIIFSPDLYKEKKREIENLTGHIVFAQCRYNKKVYGVTTTEFHTLDELLGAEIPLELKEELKVIGWERRYLNSITDCGCCNLSRSRKNVVPAEIGKYNMLIVAESPGQNEDREGTPLIGAAGDVLWDQLADYGLNRNDFCVSNVVKCQPPGNKLDKCPDSIVACKDWLDMEIKNIKPFVILSLGKHAKEFFSDSKFGVMTLNGAIEWNTNYECWIVYCLHPASTFHGLSNKAAFNNAIETFAELIDHLT